MPNTKPFVKANKHKFKKSTQDSISRQVFLLNLKLILLEANMSQKYKGLVWKIKDSNKDKIKI